MSNRIIVWYSDGAASACAAKLSIVKYGPIVEVVKCDNTTVNEHEDNIRFRNDVQKWIDKKIILIRSDKYNDIDDVFEKTRYMAGINGARCTTELKKLPRRDFADDDDTNIFGYTWEEEKRIIEFELNNPEIKVEWILYDNFILKIRCLRMLREAGIRLPTMYQWFDHNNCKGCVKATSPGYWNKTRRLFPEVFNRRAEQSRKLGVKLVRVKGERIFLDELPLNEGLSEPDGEIECGPFCQQPSIR